MNEGREVNVAEETPRLHLNLFQFIFRSTLPLCVDALGALFAL